MSAFKPAENGHGYILRCYNPSAKETDAEVNTGLRLQKVSKTQLNERDLAELPIQDKTQVLFTAKPHEIISLRLQFGGSL